MEGNGMLVKEVVVAHAGRNFRNGNQSFDLTEATMDELIGNFERLGRQVPIYVGGEHFEGRGDRPADGWVEGLRRQGKDLLARISLSGHFKISFHLLHLNQRHNTGVTLIRLLPSIKSKHGKPRKVFENITTMIPRQD